MSDNHDNVGFELTKNYSPLKVFNNVESRFLILSFRAVMNVAIGLEL